VLQKMVIHHHYLELMDRHQVQVTVSYKECDLNEQL
jgi:UDP-N-acetylglucosamine transferase subunit ALG13